MSEAEAFVYVWTDCSNIKFYIGKHKGNTSDGYICSSKIMLEEYNKRPDDFYRHILAEGTHEDMLALEEKYLGFVNAAANSCYYNQTNGNKKFCIPSGEKIPCLVNIIRKKLNKN